MSWALFESFVPFFRYQDERMMKCEVTGVGLVPKVILFTFQYGGQIDIYLSDMFCFGANILNLHSEIARG